MGDIVNLSRIRKQKSREDRASEAEANRMKFGRGKAEKQQDRLETARAEVALDGHKIED